MISIQKVAIGNGKEAFVEKRLTNGCNIIFSYDNNKGKTILLQAIAYALGNEPIFPSGFEYKNLYFYIELKNEKDSFKICRRDHSFIIKYNGQFYLYDSISDFKYFFHEYIYQLPRILKDKDNVPKIVDPLLFIQLFFVGQDARDTSTIFHNSYYTKNDFMNLIYAWMGCCVLEDGDNPEEIKKLVSQLKDKRHLLVKKSETINKISESIAYVSYIHNQKQINDKIKLLESKNTELTSLKKKINRLHNSKIKNKNLLNELNSLNRDLNEGKLKCLDCGSDVIGYENSNKNVSFEISDVEIRNNIQNVITRRIESADDEIKQLSAQMKVLQQEIRELMKDSDLTVENLLLSKQEILNIDDIDKQVVDIDEEINVLTQKLNAFAEKTKIFKSSKERVEEQIITIMNQFYKDIDPAGRLSFDSLFSQKYENYSGSENTEFYLAKLYALACVLRHPFPIIVDGFREGEVASEKEEVILDFFLKLPNQIILTTTLKDEERDKYLNKSSINPINYEGNEPSHILNSMYVDDFCDILRDMNLSLRKK